MSCGLESSLDGKKTTLPSLNHGSPSDNSSEKKHFVSTLPVLPHWSTPYSYSTAFSSFYFQPCYLRVYVDWCAWIPLECRFMGRLELGLGFFGACAVEVVVPSDYRCWELNPGLREEHGMSLGYLSSAQCIVQPWWL